jgi:tetratricopeptide (TPR) repeat protein
MYSVHADFMGEVQEHTGIGKSPAEVIEKLSNHDDVIAADPVSILHKLQKHIAITHISCDFQSSARMVNPEYASLLQRSMEDLERLSLEYPSAPEIYEKIARSAQLLLRERMAADYWALAIETDVAFDRRVLDRMDRLAINSTMARIGDEGNSHLACTHPYRFSISAIFGKSLFGKSKKDLATWPSRRDIGEMIKLLREDEAAQVGQGFRSVLTEFRQIKSFFDATFDALMSGEIDSDDLDNDELNRMNGRLPILMHCLRECEYFRGAEAEYWIAHLQLYIAHRCARRSDIEEGLKAADKAIELFRAFESRPDYPDCVPTDLLEEYDHGAVSTSLHAYLTKAGLYSQSDRLGEACDAYAESVERSRSGVLGSAYLPMALIKAGEHHLFHDTEKSIEYLAQAVAHYDSVGVSLDGTIAEGDVRLLKLMDTLATAHQMQGNESKYKKLLEKISPYDEYVTWRYSGNILEEIEGA